MLRATFFHPEGPRYAAPLVILPGLWTGPEAYRPFASFLAHRGWEGHVLDLRAGNEGIAARAHSVVEYMRRLAAPPVLLGHDAGAVVALAALALSKAAAVILLSPLVPGSVGARTIALRPTALPSLLFGQRVGPPGGHACRLLLSGLPRAAQDAAAAKLDADSTAAVLDVGRGRVDMAPPGDVPGLLLHGTEDPLLSVTAGATLAAELGLAHETIAGAGHWPFGGLRWQQAVGAVHRWIVRRLGEPLLDLYAETMAERDADDEDPEP